VKEIQSPSTHKQDASNEKSEATKPKKEIYERPAIKTESLTAVAALCNGLLSGGRKQSLVTGCLTGNLKS
jgi:hypothetical protein